MERPVLQVALDFVDLDRAVQVCREAVGGGVDWIEVGTPLIKSEGLNSVRRMRQEFPDHKIIADMKTIDAGRTEVECAAKAGANIIDVLGASSDATIAECVDAARNYGAEIVVDMIEVADPVKRAKAAEVAGANYIAVHTAIDVQMTGGDPFQVLDTTGVGKLVEIGTMLGRVTNPKLKVGICGEHGGEPNSVAFCHKVGMNYVSCSPFRVPIARLAAAQATIK